MGSAPVEKLPHFKRKVGILWCQGAALRELIGPDGLVKELTKALVERMLSGEMKHHPGYEKYDVAGRGTGNSRNGKSQKTLKGEAGEMTIAIPRDL